MKKVKFEVQSILKDNGYFVFDLFILLMFLIAFMLRLK